MLRYLKDLQALLDTLGKADSWYIRCFKPNNVQKSHQFSGGVVLEPSWYV